MIVHTTYKANFGNLMTRFIDISSKEGVSNSTTDLEETPGFPQVVVVFDGCHTNIKTPFDNSGNYVSKKG